MRENLILDYNGLKKYIENNYYAISMRDGVCSHCSWKLQCAKNIRWCVDTSLSKQQSHILRRALKHLPSNIVWKLFVKSYLPCDSTVAEIIPALPLIEDEYNALGDERSKETLIGMLMYRLTLDEAYPIYLNHNSKQYFVEELCNLGPDEIVIDCGAFTGDTLEEYLNHNAPPLKYYLFESNIDNIAQIEHTVEKCDAKGYSEIKPYGIWSENGTLWYSPSRYGGAGGGYISNVPKKHSVAVHVVTIDDVVPLNETVTLIKMDIEGAEQEAIKGAKNTIKHSKPKLAICTYHKSEDMWNIFNLIHKNFPEYKHYYMRHYHNRSYGDTVLYAYG